MSKTRDKILRIVSDARSEQRVSSFFSISKTSLSLAGKSVSEIVSCTERDKLHEIVLPEGEGDCERFEGDAVTTADVFESGDDAVWVDGTIRFEAGDGILLTANQYAYIKKYGPLPRYTYFGQANDGDSTLPRIWRELSRRAFEARSDKGKDILYLTLGTVTWTKEEATAAKSAERVTSPLLLCPITEHLAAKDRPRFRLTGDAIRVNSILRRELKARNMDVFLNVPDTIPYGNGATDALKVIGENARYLPGVTVNPQSVNLCILDSTNESICQLIERNLDRLEKSPLIRVLAGEMSYEDMAVTPIAPYAVYPLLADDTQREVIEAVRQGHCVNISAAAGTGKSQTMVNIAALEALSGRRVCVMSEKAAANEVFMKYAAEIGLEKFCLVLDNKTTVSRLVSQIDRIRNNARVYLDPIRSRDLLSETAEIEALLGEYDRAVYEELPRIGMTLYDLIGEAIAAEACEHTDSLAAGEDSYRYACRKLDELGEDIGNTVSKADFESYLQTGTTGDEEADELLGATVSDLLRVGVDVLRFAKENGLPADAVTAAAKANLARKLAAAAVEAKGLGKFGNVFLRAKYAKLTECYSRLRSLYAAFMQQEISARVAEAVANDRALIPLLERIRTARISVSDFFRRYGAAVLKLCPIVVTTPSVAVNYMTDEMNVFDALLIDEASQVPIISVLPFLVGERQLIAFGDNMQLDITGFFRAGGASPYDENGEFDLSRSDRSILHLVQGKGIPTKRLLYHYRSKTQHLVTVSNLLCYNGNLNVVPDVYTGWDKLPEELGFSLRRVHVPFDPAAAAASAVKRTRRGGGKTVTEYPYLADHDEAVEERMAEEIALCVWELRERSPEKNVGIVTLNDRFRDKILDALEHALPGDDLTTEETVFVRSLENAQGREADVMILAIEHDKRNVKGKLLKNISGFFNAGEITEQSGNNRLNVLFTRAREKNLVYVGFDYGELKDAERSLGRLYTYLEYAATGNMSCVGEAKQIPDRANERAAAVVAEALPGCTVRRKVGEGTLTVDIAVMEGEDARQYQVGFLMPDRKLTPNALCTKINLLERAGWRVLPLSLIYLLERADTFRTQLPRMLGKDKRLGSAESESYLTSVPPAMPVTLEEIARRGEITAAAEETVAEIPFYPTITPEKLATLGVEAVCRAACEDELRFAPQEVIDARYETDRGALLIKLAQSVQKYAEAGDEDKLEKLSKKVYFLYKNLGEGRACYLMALLLRLLPNCESETLQALIREAMTEAARLNLIGEEII